MKERKTLDKSKPFGTICGNGGASFIQDGVHFDNLGRELFADEVTALKIENEPKPATAAPAVDTALQGRVKELESKIDELQQQNFALNESLGEVAGILTETRQTTEEAIARLEAKVSELSATVNDLNFPATPPKAR